MARQWQSQIAKFKLPVFEPVDRSHAEFLKQRTASMLETVPMYASLRKKLLDIGGVDVVPPVIDVSSTAQLARQCYDVSQTLHIGRTRLGAGAKVVEMGANTSHLN